MSGITPSFVAPRPECQYEEDGRAERIAKLAERYAELGGWHGLEHLTRDCSTKLAEQALRARTARWGLLPQNAAEGAMT